MPIYWLNGNKVADQYEDFYDGDWDDGGQDAKDGTAVKATILRRFHLDRRRP